MKKILKNCVALLLITLVAGLSLAVVNEVTKQPIADAEYKARMEAYEVVFPGATFKEADNNEELTALRESFDNKCTIDDVLVAVDDNGNLIGYVMSATSPSGYGGNVQVAVGISNETCTLTGFTVLSHSETAGLGARCTEEEFQSQFIGKVASVITYVKGGGASGDDEIDAISGATITSNAVTEAVNAANSFYNQNLITYSVKEGA